MRCVARKSKSKTSEYTYMYEHAYKQTPSKCEFIGSSNHRLHDRKTFTTH